MHNSSAGDEQSSKGRELSEAERELLEAMIRYGVDFPPDESPSPITQADRERWLAASANLRVHDGCGCGLCPSIDFGPIPDDADRYVLEASTPESLVLLFIDDDKPSYLEIAPYGEEAVGLPSPDELTFPTP